MDIHDIIVLILDVFALVSMMIPVLIAVKKLKDGVKCQLRTEMLRIYYHNRGKETIRQYELENFIALYEGYKALKGNSFIDKIYKEVITWEVVS